MVRESILQQFRRAAFARSGRWQLARLTGKNIEQRTPFAPSVSHLEASEQPSLQLVRLSFSFLFQPCQRPVEAFNALQKNVSLSPKSLLHAVQLGLHPLAFGPHRLLLQGVCPRLSQGIAPCFRPFHLLFVSLYLAHSPFFLFVEPIFQLLSFLVGLQSLHFSVEKRNLLLVCFEVSTRQKIVKHGRNKTFPVAPAKNLPRVGREIAQRRPLPGQPFHHQYPEHLSPFHLCLPLFARRHSSLHLLGRQQTKRVRLVEERIVQPRRLRNISVEGMKNHYHRK